VSFLGLNDDVKGKIKNTFGEILDLLDVIEFHPNENPDENSLKYVEWMKKKLELRYGTVRNGKFEKREYPNFPVFPTGLYWAYLGVNVGSEEDKHRPVLVLRASRNQDQCTIIPLSSQRLNDTIDFHVDLTDFNNTALIEQMRVISKKRIDKPLRTKGRIATVTNDEDLKKIYEQISKYYATMLSRNK
jgi:mRNA-degrading endonuclease toxin of MazEF toxin-antitoxin module